MSSGLPVGRVLGGALRLLRRRRVLGLGLVAALTGLVYVTLHAALTAYNPRYLNDLGDSLTADLPPALPLWLAGGALLLLLGGLWSEAGLILAGRSARGAVSRRTRAGRLPGLLAVGLRVWAPLLIGLALVLAPVGYWVLARPAPSDEGSVLVQGSAGLALLLAIGGWLVLWPRQRLANCALLLDDQAPAAAVQAARRLVRTRGRAVYGLWTTQLLLNLGLLLVSALLAGLAAGLMAGLWALLGADTAPSPPIAILVAGTVLLIGLLCWDGVVSAFTLSTWAVAYGELQRDPDAPLTPVGTTQLLGRQE